MAAVGDSPPPRKRSAAWHGDDPRRPADASPRCSDTHATCSAAGRPRGRAQRLAPLLLVSLLGGASRCSVRGEPSSAGQATARRALSTQLQEIRGCSARRCIYWQGGPLLERRLPSVSSPARPLGSSIDQASTFAHDKPTTNKQTNNIHPHFTRQLTTELTKNPSYDYRPAYSYSNTGLPLHASSRSPLLSHSIVCVAGSLHPASSTASPSSVCTR